MNYLENALHIARLSDTGKLRLRNEDSIASDSSIGLALLADGMGGYNAGDVASQMAALTITAELKTCFKNAFDSGHCIDATNASAHIIDAVNAANKAILQVSHEQAQCAGMGTTLVLGLFIDNQVIVGHIGDSRAYRFRDQALQQITNDHSLLQEQLDSGLLTPEQAKFATYKNFVTKALGIEAVADLELNTYDTLVGDIYLLCSDGLSDMLEHEEIESILTESKGKLEHAANALVQKANLHGGKDNISVILIEVVQKFSLKKSTWYKNILKKVVDKG
ncbi:MAG: Stp1/IreP family PP2C-type Ser/Thr phosphatase [Methylophilus sp.]|nr:Stp1/IreP family PP2C-type Ser/Thr phosphatase [Methylophilus sp.]